MKRSFRVEKAERHIRYLIEQENLSPGTRLPSLSRLARMAGVSFATMWKAVQRLKSEGVIGSNPHARLRVGGHTSEEESPDGDLSCDIRLEGKSGPRVISVSQRLERDILNGLYPPGQRFGPIKTLANRYGVCYATMKLALSRLVEKGIIEENRKQFVVPYPVAPPSSTHIRLIGIDAPNEVLALGSVGGEFLQRIETECVRSGVGLEIISFHLEDNSVIYNDLASGKSCDLQDSEKVQGYIYLIVAETASKEEIYRRLQFFRKPVAVFDVIGVQQPRCIMGDRNFRFFLSTASMNGAIRMAKFLAGKEHAKAAYFSPYHANKWSQTRLRGLQKGFEAAGHPGAVSPFTLDRISHSDYLSDSLRDQAVSALFERLRQWEREYTNDAVRHIGWGVRFHAEQESEGTEIRRRFTPFFAEALSNAAITVWIGANDLVARYALEYLNERGVEVPGRVSVVGFDDGIQAIERRLTSYNFNTTSLARAVLDYVLRKGEGPWTRRNQCIEIEGIIVERRTTSRAHA